MLSLVDTVNQLAALPVDGVQRRETVPPQSVNRADMPYLFVQLPQEDVAPITFDGGAWTTISVDVVIVIRPTVQGSAGEGLQEAMSYCDKLADALSTAKIGKAALHYNILPTIVVIGRNTYWGAVAKVKIYG